jgi:hypothetical protein
MEASKEQRRAEKEAKAKVKAARTLRVLRGDIPEYPRTPSAAASWRAMREREEAANPRLNSTAIVQRAFNGGSPGVKPLAGDSPWTGGPGPLR